jgi:hypothetical protein
MTEPAGTIWAELDRWAKELPDWKRRIIRIAAARGNLSDKEIEDTYSLFLAAANVETPADASSAPEPPEVSGRPAAPSVEPVVLAEVSDLCGVNALPTGASLTFIPTLTIIYGGNGAGKSGFARLLANACFSRECPEIIGNIYAEGGSPPASAKLHVSVGGVDQVPIVFSKGVSSPNLKRITVFDSAVARHHITQSAAVEFRPVGFDVFAEMARSRRGLTPTPPAERARMTFRSRSWGAARP